MSRRISSLLSILFALTMLAQAVSAHGQTVFGPEDCKIGGWHIHLSSHKFRLEEREEGTLIVTKNTPEMKIRGGFILLNRSPVSLRNFFAGNELVFEKKVQIVPTNRMLVFLRGTPTASVTIEVRREASVPQPQVNFWAEPETIPQGASAKLKWETIYADQVGIDQNIGQVEPSGERDVTPMITTAYTLTAQGEGGTTTKVVTVTVIPPPTVSLAADPEIIESGQSATLKWSSTNADTASIDPDIGDVNPNDSIKVQPMKTTTYKITVVGLAGTATDSAAVTVIRPITLSIISPSEGSTISKMDVMVEGSVNSMSALETGVVVNGIIANVQGNEFFANHVPLEEGENDIVAVATDSDGKTVTASTKVFAESTADYLRLTSDRASGVSPLEIKLRIDTSFGLSQPSLAYQGPGQVEFLDGQNGMEYRIKITGVGTYHFTADAVDNNGNTYTDTVAVVVLNQWELDLLLRDKWNGMRRFLQEGDIEGALGYFLDGYKADYREALTQIKDELPTVLSAPEELRFVSLSSNLAKYESIVTENTGVYSYPVLFVKDKNGIWKIRSF